MLTENRKTVPQERPLPHEHLIGHDRKGIVIRVAVRFGSGQHGLRRHVGRRTGDLAVFTLTYAGESWTQDTSYVAECVDTVTRVPTWDKVDVFGSRTLSATGRTSADPVTSLTSLTGTESLSVPEPGCGSGGVEVTYSIAMTRTGD